MASVRTIRTLKKRETFITALRSHGNVSEACAAALIGRTAAYAWRADEPAFAAEWDEALDEAADTMEREAWRRAVEGVDEPVFGSMGQGLGSGEVGRIRKYSDTLLIFMLKAARPEKFRERTETRHTGLTPQQAADLSTDDLEAELKKRGLPL
jgi:hypothetical protein